MLLPLSPETGNVYVQTHIYVCLVCAKNKAFERENKHIRDGAVVNQVQHMLPDKPACIHCYVFMLFINKFLSLIFNVSTL
jgi:hypothetical protein